MAFAADLWGECSNPISHFRMSSTVSRRKRLRHDLAFVVDHDVQLEAIEPPHARLAPPGQSVEGPVAVGAAVVADGELGRVGEVDAGLLAAHAVQQVH